jgi:hypothetical protein
VREPAKDEVEKTHYERGPLAGAVVVARHAERRRRAAEHLHRARAVDFDPERRLVVTDVAQQRTQDQAREGRRHRAYRPAVGRRTIVLAADKGQRSSRIVAACGQLQLAARSHLHQAGLSDGALKV